MESIIERAPEGPLLDSLAVPDSKENGRPGGRAASGEEGEQVAQRPPLDPAIEARREAAFRLIRAFGDPVLRSKAGAVTRFDESLREEVARMDRLMGDALGLGLAAPQMGVLHRLFVYRAGPDAPLVAVVNPRLEWSSQEEEIAEEGCLSLPRVLVDVERPLHVRVSARDEQGQPIRIEASGLEARVIQHEMDHLDGVLILDRATRDQRKEALRILRGGEDHVHDAVTAGGDAGA
jgi:peptide deformylase